MKTPESCVVVCFLASQCCNSIEGTPLIFDYVCISGLKTKLENEYLFN